MSLWPELRTNSQCSLSSLNMYTQDPVSSLCIEHIGRLVVCRGIAVMMTSFDSNADLAVDHLIMVGMLALLMLGVVLIHFLMSARGAGLAPP